MDEPDSSSIDDPRKEIMRDTLSGKRSQAEVVLAQLGIYAHRAMYKILAQHGYVWDGQNWKQEGLYDHETKSYHKICISCGKQFAAKRHHARTCSDTCRRRHNRVKSGTF